MQTTLSELVESVSFALTNSTTVDSELKTEIQRRLHESLQNLMGMVDLPDYRVEATLSATSGSPTGIYDLPRDFYKIIEDTVYMSAPVERRLVYYRHQDWVRSHEFQRSTTGTPEEYTIPGRDPNTGEARIQIFPIPDTTATIKYSYYAMPKDIRDTNPDSDVIDSRFPFYARDALIAMTVLKFPQYIVEAKTMAFYQQELRMHIAAIKRHTLSVSGQEKQRRQFFPNYGLSPRTAAWPGTFTGTPYT